MSDILLCYVAFPYTAATRERVLLNTQAATHLGALVAEIGCSPLMPTRNSYNMDVLCKGGTDAHELATSQEFWLDATEAQLLVCDAAIFGAGWDKSFGCVQEMQVCKENSIPAFTDIQQLEQWHNDIKEGRIG